MAMLNNQMVAANILCNRVNFKEEAWNLDGFQRDAWTAVSCRPGTLQGRTTAWLMSSQRFTRSVKRSWAGIADMCLGPTSEAPNPLVDDLAWLQLARGNIWANLYHRLAVFTCKFSVSSASGRWFQRASPNICVKGCGSNCFSFFSQFLSASEMLWSLHSPIVFPSHLPPIAPDGLGWYWLDIHWCRAQFRPYAQSCGEDHGLLRVGLKDSCLFEDVCSKPNWSDFSVPIIHILT